MNYHEFLLSLDNETCVWQISVVNQEPVLFSGTIRDNIAYGLSDCSLEEIQEAARKANAHDFIERLEKGYDTGEQAQPAAVLFTRLSA